MKKDCNLLFNSNLQGGGTLPLSIVKTRLSLFCRRKWHCEHYLLPPEHRMAVAYALMYFHNYSALQVATILCCSKTTYFNDISKAKFTLGLYPRNPARRLLEDIQALESYILYNAKYMR